MHGFTRQVANQHGPTHLDFFFFHEHHPLQLMKVSSLNMEST